MPMPRPEPRDKIIEALLSLTTERAWNQVTLEAVAERAGVTLGALRANYVGRLAVLADFVSEVDEKVLEGRDAELAGEAPRERLFDLLVARFEALAPHKQAIRNIGHAARREPLLAIELNRIVATSMVWMLAASGLPAEGARGALRAQALALIWARVLRVWLDDDDPGFAKTMAALDKHLREAERAAKRLDSIKECLCRPLKSRREKRPPEAADLSEAHPT
jgi:AcrR family transcriptional regulator